MEAFDSQTDTIPTEDVSVTSPVEGDTVLPVGGATTPPLDGTSATPEGGATTQTADGVTVSPEGGATASTVDGASAPPSDGTSAPPGGGATAPTVDGASSPPSDGTSAPPEGGATAPTVDGTTAAQTGGAKALNVNSDTLQRILGTIFGQCIGDALGLLTEFLTKKECEMYYKTVKKELEFFHKEIVCDGHRMRWAVGDWTDDSDQMILILLSLIEKQGQVDVLDFGRRIKRWTQKGFMELGDFVGMGQGKTTSTVINNPDYINDPQAAADLVWTANGKYLAPNGAVMRTSILGVHMYADLDVVAQNAIAIARTTHADPRCQASTVAVCVAIALMLQRQPKHLDKKENYNVDAIIRDCYDYASKCLETDKEKKELKTYLKCKKLKELKLDEPGKIGYTYKSMGSAFWALKQENFREAITKIVMEGGDADSNACVAGALLGCKYGVGAIPSCWTQKLKHKEWLEAIIDRYFHMMAKVHGVDFTPYWTGHVE